MLWAPGAILGPVWGILDTSWNLLEAILVSLEPSWSLLVHLDASGEALGDHLGAIWVAFGRHFAHFGFILNDVGSILELFLTIRSFVRSLHSCHVICLNLPEASDPLRHRPNWFAYDRCLCSSNGLGGRAKRKQLSIS